MYTTAAALYFATLAILLHLHLTVRRYSWVSHAVSDYGVGPGARLFRLYTSLGAAAAFALAISILKRDPFALGPLRVEILLALGATRFMVGVFPTDMEGEKLSRTGKLHYLFAALSFTLTYALLLSVSKSLAFLHSLGPQAYLWTAARYTCLASLVLLVATIRGRQRKLFGLFERIFILTYSVMLLMLAVVSTTARAFR